MPCPSPAYKEIQVIGLLSSPLTSLFTCQRPSAYVPVMGVAPPSGAGARLLLSYVVFFLSAGGLCNKPFSTFLFDKKGRMLIITLVYRTTKHRAVPAYCLDKLLVQTRILLLWLPPSMEAVLMNGVVYVVLVTGILLSKLKDDVYI